MSELTVFGTDTPFRCETSAEKGSLIFYDETGYLYLPAASHTAIAEAFAGKTATVEELRQWLADNIGFRRDIAGHVAAVLVDRGLAEARDNTLIFPASG
ncbi:hypothetical protein JXA47_12335 [Candidatus Sumerlaeota bacterium]|nr:hypothetical protein [Candidatus Sumerlaeota bacterium]